MNSNKDIAGRFREVLLNGTWIANTNYKDQLTNTSWELAVTKVHDLNTIAALTSHIQYYISGLINVFEGGSLDIKDKYSFDFPEITSQKDWDKILLQLWKDAEKFADLIEKFPENKLNEVFVDEKYGSYQRNIDAMIEHCYYHLGQIVLIKKIIVATN
jgi:hypothetical protein